MVTQSFLLNKHSIVNVIMMAQLVQPEVDIYVFSVFCMSCVGLFCSRRLVSLTQART